MEEFKTSLSDFIPVKVSEKSDDIEAKRDRRRTVLLFLKNMMKNKTFVKGRVVAVENIASRQSGTIPCLVLELLHSAIKVTDKVRAVIPFSSVFPVSPIKENIDSDPKKEYLIKSGVLYKMIGAEVMFIITRESTVEDPKKTAIVVGNRAIAMRMIRELCFGERQMVKAGSIYQGKIVSKAPQTLVIELGGIEKPFHKQHITSRYIADFTSPQCPKEYQIGASIDVYIESTRKMENGEYTAEFNMIRAEQEKTKHIRDNLVLGTKTTAVIGHVHTFTNADGQEINSFYGWLEYGCPCKITSVTTSVGSQIPEPGDIVSCIIRKIGGDTVIVSMRDVIGRV